jgi:hypothetical protein
MQDTSIEMQRIYHDLLMSKTGEERFLMGISMFQIARELVLASFPKDLSEEQKRVLLMKRFYGREIDEKAKNKKRNPLQFTFNKREREKCRK